MRGVHAAARTGTRAGLHGLAPRPRFGLGECGAASLPPRGRETRGRGGPGRAAGAGPEELRGGRGRARGGRAEEVEGGDPLPRRGPPAGALGAPEPGGRPSASARDGERGPASSVACSGGAMTRGVLSEEPPPRGKDAFREAFEGVNGAGGGAELFGGFSVSEAPWDWGRERRVCARVCLSKAPNRWGRPGPGVRAPERAATVFL